MIKTTFLVLLSLISLQLFAQINMEDSTVQVVSYWDKGEKQNYAISLEKIKLKDGDTTAKELITYEVEVSVIDSSKNCALKQPVFLNPKEVVLK